MDAPRVYATFRYRNPLTVVEWLKDVLAFRVTNQFMDGSVLVHAELALGNSMIMIGSVRDDEFGRLVGTPGETGGKSIYVAVDDSNLVYARAEAAGTKILQELTDRSYGSREFICSDPENNVWCIGTYRPAP